VSKEKLEKLIQKNRGYITTQEAQHEGIHREYLTMFVQEEKLVRTSPGIYQSPHVWEDKLYNYQQKRKFMIYSHETALYLHGLSDRDPIFYSVTLPTGYNTSQIKHQDLKTFTIKNTIFELGQTKIKTAYGNEITIYDKERTICDVIRSRNRMDRQLINDGLRRYMSHPSKNVNKLMCYAKEMGIEKVLRDYLEILL